MVLKQDMYNVKNVLNKIRFITTREFFHVKTVIYFTGERKGLIHLCPIRVLEKIIVKKC